MSNIFKGFETSLHTNKKMISIKPFAFPEEEENVDNVDLEPVNTNEREILEQQKKEWQEQFEKTKQELELYVLRERDALEQAKKAWEEERFLLSEQAKKEGYERGIELGREEMELTYQSHINEAKLLGEKVMNQYNNHLENNDEIMMSIGIQIAEEILRTSLKENKELLLPVIKKVLQEVKEQSQIIVRIHPSYYDLVQNSLEEWKNLFPPETLFTVLVDEELQLHELFVETPFGKIDASLTTQIELIKEKLLDLVVGESI